MQQVQKTIYRSNKHLLTDIEFPNILITDKALIQLSTNTSANQAIHSQFNPLNKSKSLLGTHPQQLKINSMHGKHTGSTNSKQYTHKVSTGPPAEP